MQLKDKTAVVTAGGMQEHAFPVEGQACGCGIDRIVRRECTLGTKDNLCVVADVAAV